MFLAKLFGKKYTMQDEEGTVIFYDWKGYYYITKIIPKDEHEFI